MSENEDRPTEALTPTDSPAEAETNAPTEALPPTEPLAPPSVETNGTSTPSVETFGSFEAPKQPSASTPDEATHVLPGAASAAEVPASDTHATLPLTGPADPAIAWADSDRDRARREAERAEREAQRTLRDAKREAQQGRRESERAERERRRAGKPRIGATIWGLLLVLAGLSIGAASLGATFDLVLAAVIVLCLGGIALIAGSIRAALRRQG